MLVLTRRVGEVIRIGDDIVITVVGVQRDTVRLSIQAPREVRVHREEVYLQVQAANAEAARNADADLSALAGVLRPPAPGAAAGRGVELVTAEEPAIPHPTPNA